MSTLMRVRSVDPNSVGDLFEGIMQDLVNTVNRRHSSGVKALIDKESYPRIDLSEDDERVYIDATVPGLTKDQVDVSYNEGVLTISGHKVTAHDKRQFNTREIRHSQFSRSVLVNEEFVDSSTIAANVQNGILHITLKKREEAKPKAPLKITVE